MATVSTKTSYGDGGKAYDYGYYHCTDDDTWMTLETPQEDEDEES